MLLLTNKKKVSFFIPTLNAGGIEANTIRLAKGFIKDGFQVDLLVANSNGEYKERVSNEVNIIDFKCNKIIKTLPKLIRYIKTEKPSVLISASEGANIVTSISRFFLRRYSTKIIISIRTHLSTEYSETNSKMKRFFPMISKVFYPKVDGIVTVSRGVAEDVSELLQIPLKKISVIYNPIVDDTIEALSSEKIEHPFFKDSRDYPIILGAGRLTKQKDFETLLYAFKEVRKKMMCKLVIIGEGEERKRLEALIQELNISDDTDLIGFVQNPYSYMKNADLFVLSSAWEGFGNVIVEAMATGTNIVSTNCPSGPSEILEGGVYGELVDVGDYKNLSEGIIKVLKNPLPHNVLKKRANYFSVATALNKYKELAGLK